MMIVAKPAIFDFEYSRRYTTTTFEVGVDFFFSQTKASNNIISRTKKGTLLFRWLPTAHTHIYGKQWNFQ